MSRDVDRYFEAVPAERTAHLKTLHDLITGLYPAALVDLHYRMPTYRHGDGWVAIANQKHYVSLYTCSAAHIARFKQQHPDYKTGKGCINFRPGDALPLEALRDVVRHAMERPKGD